MTSPDATSDSMSATESAVYLTEIACLYQVAGVARESSMLEGRMSSLDS